MEYKGLQLDKFQEDAINAIEQKKSVVVSAPTGCGKTLIADYLINRDLKKGLHVIYTSPIKALSNQKYKEFTESFGKEKVGLLTGDVVENSKGTLLIMTTEIYRNMALAHDPILENVSAVIFDEIHYLNDIERGYVWEESIIFSNPKVRFLALSATIPNARQFANWIQAIKDHEVIVIKHTVRPVPLEIQFFDAYEGIENLEHLKEAYQIPLRKTKKPFEAPPSGHITLITQTKENVPALYFLFSRAGCQQKAKELAKKQVFPVDTSLTGTIQQIWLALSPEIRSLTSTQILRQTLPYGIGFHHAGLLPKIKEIVEDLFAKGLIKVLYTTETFAVGLNFPAKSVYFESLRKYDGVNFRFLNSKEFFQIAGRAGRRGIDSKGYVYVTVTKQDFDYHKIKNLTSKDTEPIHSQFKLSVNTVLNLIKRHKHKEIEEVLCKNFYSYQKYGPSFLKRENERSHYAFRQHKKRLIKQGYIKDEKLTPKGEFASQLYTDEVPFTEIFATEFFKTLTRYQVLLIVASLCYEHRKNNEFYNVDPSKEVKALHKKLKSHPVLNKEERFNTLLKVTAIINPCMTEQSIFATLKNTNLLEGDVLRWLYQMLDRFNQLKVATKDKEALQTFEYCSNLLKTCLKEAEL